MKSTRPMINSWSFGALLHKTGVNEFDQKYLTSPLRNGGLSMEAKFLVPSACMALLGIFSTGTASADTYETFSASGSFATVYAPLTSPLDLSGTITVDVTTGTISGADLGITGVSPFTTVISDTVNSSTSQTLTVSTASNVWEMELLITAPNVTTYPYYTLWTGVTTAPISSGEVVGPYPTLSTPVPPYITDAYGCTNCALTLVAPAPVPVPPSYVLALTGLCGIGFTARRRRAADISPAF